MVHVPHPIVEHSNDDIDHLMARVCAGDKAAFAQIFDRYHRLVFATATRIVENDDLAEDITQIVFLKLWATPLAYRGGSFAAWIIRVTRNASIDERRRNASLARSESDEPLHRMVAPDTIFEHLQATMLRESLTGLHENQRALIDLNFFDDLTHEQIAQRTGVPLGTVKTRIRSGIARLRESPALATS